jgi:hypothetical protein
MYLARHMRGRDSNAEVRLGTLDTIAIGIIIFIFIILG